MCSFWRELLAFHEFLITIKINFFCCPALGKILRFRLRKLAKHSRRRSVDVTRLLDRFWVEGDVAFITLVCYSHRANQRHRLMYHNYSNTTRRNFSFVAKLLLSHSWGGGRRTSAQRMFRWECQNEKTTWLLSREANILIFISSGFFCSCVRSNVIS